MQPLITNCELPLQLLVVDDQVLVVCAGPCGEAFSFIEKGATDQLVDNSITLHRLIDRLVKHKKASRSHLANLVARMQALGELLFSCVFKDKLLDLLNITVGQAIRQERNVAIRLMVATDWLNIIPWELLCSRGTYLCHTYDFVRHPFAIQPVRSPLAPNSSMRVLFVGGNPRNDLFVEDQLSAARAAVNQIQSSAVCIVSPEATYTSIADAIYSGTDILHFVAHGEYSLLGGTPRGYFLIDGEDGRKEDRLPMEMLQSFSRASPMQLAILSACRSDQSVLYNARGSGSVRAQRYNSMAHSLIQIGVPCVIGMSHPISKAGASVLARRLYYVLVNNRGSIDRAVRQARLELFAHMDDLLPSDWMTPVLYSRTAESRKTDKLV